MSEIKLLPCPFCGGEAELNLFLGNYCVTCTNCMGAIFPARGMTEEEAIEAWNTRKPMEHEVKPVSHENPFQSKRREELLAFIECGAKYAEVDMSGNVTIGREIDCYKKASRQLRVSDKVKVYQRNHKVIVERVKE